MKNSIFKVCLIAVCGVIAVGCQSEADEKPVKKEYTEAEIRQKMDERSRQWAAEELAKYPPIMTQAEKDAVCAKVKKGEYKKIPLLTAEEAGMDFKEIQKKFDSERSGPVHLYKEYGPFISLLDYNNDGQTGMTLRVMYASGAGSGASLLYFYVKDDSGKFIPVIAGTPRSPIGRHSDTTYSISGKGGGQFFVEVDGINYLATTDRDPIFDKMKAVWPRDKYRRTIVRVDRIKTYDQNINYMICQF